MSDKERWILEHIPTCGVDILNEKFVGLFIEKFAPPHRICSWGAHKCRQLNNLLARMYKKGLLKRCIISLNGGAWQPGFPKWVYVYSKENMY